MAKDWSKKREAQDEAFEYGLRFPEKDIQCHDCKFKLPDIEVGDEVVEQFDKATCDKYDFCKPMGILWKEETCPFYEKEEPVPKNDAAMEAVDKRQIRELIDYIRRQMENRRLSYQDGGPGSGNHGHAGRPGKRGGSAPSKFTNMGATHNERESFRQKIASDCRDGLKKISTDYLGKKSDYDRAVSLCESYAREIDEYAALEGVTEDNFEQKKEEYFKKWNDLDASFQRINALFMRAQGGVTMEEWRNAESARNRAHRDYTLFFRDLHDTLNERDRYKRLLSQAEQDRDAVKNDLDSVANKREALLASYSKDMELMNKKILRRYPTIDKIKSVEDASEYLSARGYFKNTLREENNGLPIGTPRGGATVDLNGCDKDLARSMCSAFDKTFNKFPELAGFVQSLKNNTSVLSSMNNAMAWYRHKPDDKGGELNLNGEYFTERAKSQDLHFDGTFHPTIISSNPYFAHDAVVIHELGHAMDGFLSMKYRGAAKEVSAGRGTFTTTWTVAPNVIAKAAKNLGMTQAKLKESIGVYACKSPQEALAEAFCEYIVSDTPRPVALEIGRQIESLYKTGQLSNKERGR